MGNAGPKSKERHLAGRAIQCLLHGESATDRLRRRGKVSQNAISSRVEDTSAMLLDDRI